MALAVLAGPAVQAALPVLTGLVVPAEEVECVQHAVGSADHSARLLASDVRLDPILVHIHTR